MSKKHYIVILLITIAGLVASTLLMPRSQEIALMQMKDKHFEEARTAYEAQRAQGNLNIEVATRLSELYLQVGDVNKAVEVMEQFVEASPTHLAARKRLGTYYQYAQRQDDYLRNLEEINQLKPKPENLKTLSDIYNFNTQYNKQADALERLIETEEKVEEKTSAKNFVDLASIHAAEKKYDEAVSTLQNLKLSHPDDFSFHEEELLVTLLFDAKRPQDAAAEAGAWVQEYSEAYNESARLINIVHFRGGAQLANPIMANFNKEQIDANPSLLEEYILLMIADGRDEEAFQRLKTLYANDKLTTVLKKRLMLAAILRHETELARNLLKETELKAFSEPEVLSLTELAVLQNEKWLLKEITNNFDEESYGDTYPILIAMLAVSNKRKDAKAKLKALDETDLTGSQMLQIARICTRNKNYSCSRHFLAKMPPASELSDVEVANVGSLYLDMRQWDKGYKYITNAAKGRNSLDIDQVRIKYAAVRGEDEKVEAWLKGHKNSVSPRMLADLYFAAFNNKQLTTTVMIAEFYHAKQNTAQSRSYLSQAYVQTGQYEGAIALLRKQNPMTESDENNYVTALAKLSRNNAEYRKELTDFASAKLASNISKKQKMAMVYALISAKQITPALPAIRQLALAEGGQWAALYADSLDKLGRHEESRTFWLTVANQPSTSDKQKRQIAYTLLGHGYKGDAVKLFAGLATDARYDSETIKELLYLWGPRPTQDEMAWLENRYVQADEQDKNGWVTLISNYSSSEELIAFVQRHPESIKEPGLIRSYTQHLVASGELDAKSNALAKAAKEQRDVVWLREYAQVMRDNGFNNEARSAYESIIILDPSNDVPLRKAGIIAYSQADYSSSHLYLDQYVNSEQDHSADAQSYLGFFYYAELLKLKKEKEAARPFYETTIHRIEAQQLRSSEALSIRAQSHVGAGRVAEGLKSFDAAMGLYPKDDILRADKISTLLELKRYDEARALLSIPPANKAIPVSSEILLAVANGTVRDYQLIDNGSKLIIYYSKIKERDASAAMLKNVSWINYVNEGYDSLLLYAFPGYKFDITKTGNEPSFKAVVNNDRASSQAARQTILRYELLSARTDLETGHVYNAATRLNNAVKDHPKDPQLIGFLANAENYGGNWARAQRLLKTAQALSPENEDIAELSRSMRRLHAPNIKLDYEWVKRGSQREQIATLSGFADATENVQVGMELQNNDIETRNIRRADGRIGNFKGERQRGELYARTHSENGVRSKLSLFANNDTLGAGAAFSFFNILGDTTITAEWQRPYWDFVEGVMDDAVRDRLSIFHEIKPTTRLVINGGPNINRYSVDGKDNVRTTTGFEFNAVYRLLDEKPSLLIAYGIDAEYKNNEKRSIDSNGALTRIFPLSTRELHFISLNAGYNFNESTYGDLLTGWGWDRFGGNGPAIEGRLTHELNDDFDAQIRAFYGLDNGDTDDNTSRIGGYIRWRF